MANPNIETFTGERPRCRWCGNKLKPIYQTVREGDLVERDGVLHNNTEASGSKWEPLPDAYQGPDEYPANPDEPCEDTMSLGSPTTVRWNPRTKLWYRQAQVYKTISRKFTGKFGWDGSGFFCSLGCGFRWACKQLQKARTS